MTTLGIILASTRPNRVGAPVLDWVRSALPAEAEADVIDLREMVLPAFDGTSSPKQGLPKQTEHAISWAERVASLDGLVILTPQYNGSYPGQLKTAIDYLYEEWQGLPTLLIGYGWGGAAEVLPLLEALMTRVGADVRETMGLAFGEDLDTAGELSVPAERTQRLRAALDALVRAGRSAD